MPWPAMEIEETYVFIRSKNQQQQQKKEAFYNIRGWLLILNQSKTYIQIIC